MNKTNLIFLCLALIAVGCMATLGQMRSKVDTAFTPPPSPPSAELATCGGVVIKSGEETPYATEFASEGCTDIQFTDLGSGYEFAYGTRVVVYAKQ